jgi:hypothetical protein
MDVVLAQISCCTSAKARLASCRDSSRTSRVLDIAPRRTIKDSAARHVLRLPLRHTAGKSERYARTPDPLRVAQR